MKLTGTVQHSDLEGGTWQLITDDGRRTTLLGARSELKAALGARVEVEGNLDEGFGIAMAGPQLQVRKVKKL